MEEIGSGYITSTIPFGCHQLQQENKNYQENKISVHQH